MNRLTMGQFSKVLLAIDNAHTVLQSALDWEPGLDKKQVIFMNDKHVLQATFSVYKLIPKNAQIRLPYILIGQCTSLSPSLIILDKNNFVKVSHHYLTSGGYQACFSLTTFCS